MRILRDRRAIAVLAGLAVLAAGAGGAWFAGVWPFEDRPRWTHVQRPSPAPPPDDRAMNAAIDTLCAAIRAHRMVRIEFAGGSVTVEPYAVGINRALDYLVAGWQPEGGLRVYPFERIAGVAEAADGFAERPEALSAAAAAITNSSCRV